MAFKVAVLFWPAIQCLLRQTAARVENGCDSQKIQISHMSCRGENLSKTKQSGKQLIGRDVFLLCILYIQKFESLMLFKLGSIDDLSHYVVQIALQRWRILLLQSPESWDYRHEPSHLQLTIIYLPIFLSSIIYVSRKSPCKYWLAWTLHVEHVGLELTEVWLSLFPECCHERGVAPLMALVENFMPP